MTEDEKNEEIYRLYGKFLITFEHVCHVMRTTILFLLFPDHSEKQTIQNDILVEGLTADQIRNKFFALLMNEFDAETSIYKLGKTISVVYERMIPIRNSFAHGTSFIGKSNFIKEAEDGSLLLRHPKLKKSGLDLNFKKYEITALELSIQLFDKLKYSVSIVAIAVINKRDKKIYHESFDIDKFHDSQAKELQRLEKKLQDILSK